MVNFFKSATLFSPLQTMNETKIISTAIYITVFYLLLSLLLPPGGLLLTGTLLLILFNAFFSIRYLFFHASITPAIVFLNCLQIVLFALLHSQIYQVSGASGYLAPATPSWHHWLELVSAFAFKAADIVDILEEYQLWQPHIKQLSFLSGLLILLMNILVDLFLFGTLAKLAGCWLPESDITRHTDLRRFLKRICPFVLGGIFILFSAKLFTQFMADPFRIDPSNLVRWPLENMLRTIDFGDAFQIFDWQLHSMKTTYSLATLAVCFRLVLSFYLLDALGNLHLFLTKGKGCTIEELGGHFASPSASRSSREIAARAICNLGPEAVDAAPQLLCCFTDPFPAIRQAGMDALVRIGPPAIPSLGEMLIHEQEEVRRSALETLKKIDPRWAETPEAMQLLPQLLGGLLSSNVQSKEAARRYLYQIREDWPQAQDAADFLPHFMTALSHPDAAVRLSAVEAIENMGERAERARFRLIRALADPNGHVRTGALSALNKQDPQWSRSEAAINALPFLLKQLEGTSDDAEAAGNALAQIGPPAAPFLLQWLEDNDEQTGDPKVRHFVREVLSRIDPDGCAGMAALPYPSLA